MNKRMLVRIVSLVTLILGLLLLFAVQALASAGLYDATRYLHALLGIATIVLMEMALSARR